MYFSFFNDEGILYIFLDDPLGFFGFYMIQNLH